MTDDGDVWWEGNDATPPASTLSTGCAAVDAGLAAARRRTPTPASPRPPQQCPVIAQEWEDPKGVPIDAILFGGRRATIVPLVMEAFNWLHGTFLGRDMASSENHRRRRRQGRRSAPRSRWRCCPSAATTWATTSPTG